MSECNSCGEFAVEHTGSAAVCVKCGIVSDESNITSAEINHTPKPRTSFRPYSAFEAKLCQKKRPPVTFQHAMSVIDNLFHINSVPTHDKAEIIENFKTLSKIRNFRYKEDAGVTIACCFFLHLRKTKQAMPVKTICEQVGCTKGKFSSFLNFVKSHIKNDQESCDGNVSNFEHSKEDNTTEGGALLETSVSMIRVVCSKADDEEKSRLEGKTTALVKLAHSCWLLTGRSPRSVVVASAYLCWKSMSPLRKKASFTKFCEKFEVREPLARRRIPELKALLLKLGQNIPSYNPNYVNEDNVLFHLDTILDNSETLRNDLLPDIHSRVAVQCKEYSTFRFPPEYQPRVESASAVKYDPDMNASDIEISDSEIESYIVTDTKKKVRKLCKERENDEEG